MLKVIAGTALLLLIAFLGHRRLFTRMRVPAGARFLFLTGLEFILVGFALGEELIGLLDKETLRSLTPLFSLGLGFIGLIYGIQFEGDKIARFPKVYFTAAVVQSVVTLSIVFYPSFVLLGLLFPGRIALTLTAALMLAATAACTAPAILAVLEREFRLAGAPVMELLRFISSLDSIVGLVLFGYLFCLLQALSSGGGAVESLAWLALSLGLGMAMGFLLHLLTQIRCVEEELVLFVIGMVAFSGGIALYLKLSPLFVNLVMGVVMANLPGPKGRIFQVLVGLEKPLYIVFLILAGALWKPGPAAAFLLAGLYLTLRFLGKLLGGAAAARAVRGRMAAPAELGLGLLSLGGVVIAMVINWTQLAPSAVTDLVVSGLLTAVIANELASPSLAKRLLRKLGAIR